MNILQLVRSKKPSVTYNVISWIFILCGGKLYLDYILPTNPTSKNPLIKFLYGWAKPSYPGREYKVRYWNAYIYAGVHVLGSLAFIGNMWIFWGEGL